MRSCQRSSRLGLFVAVFGLGTVVVAAVLGPLFLGDPLAQDLASGSLPPLSDGHLLGTDSLGRDLLSRIVSGGRVSLVVSLAGMAGSLAVGAVMGLAAGSSNPRVAWAADRVIDIQMALPYIILAIVLVSAFGTSLPLLVVLMVLAGWASAARVVRSVVLGERTKDYVRAAELVGASSRRILFKYIGPTIVPVLLTIAPLQASAMIVMESTLSFLGLGIQPPTPSWGGILLEGKPYLGTAWWLTTLPGLAIAITAASLLGLGSSIERITTGRRYTRPSDPTAPAGGPDPGHLDAGGPTDLLGGTA
jgi:peptide/nickel transport system permease protein